MIPKNTELSLDSKVTLLLCSDLIKCDKAKAFTIEEWRILSNRIVNSPIQTPKGLYKIDSSQWSNMLSISDNMVNRIGILLSYGGQLGFELERLDNRGIWVITRADEVYPSILKKKLGYKAPIILYGSGNIDILKGSKVAILGSREIEFDEMEYIKKLVKKCVSEKFIIVSGGSRGTDSVAEIAALQNGGNVVSVLSEDLEKHIQKKEVRNEIMNSRLLVISPYNPKMIFKSYNALGRNKYMYGLADYSVVISAIENKGGTWKGAIENLNLDISPMFVKESSIKSGNKKLQQMGVSVLKIELIQNEKEKLSTWFHDNNKVKMNTDKYDQISIENMINNKPEMNNSDIENIISSKQELSIFDTIWPIIEKKLFVDRTTEWLCESLNVRKVQLDDWLKQAEKLGRVKKILKPVRYVINKRD